MMLKRKIISTNGGEMNLAERNYEESPIKNHSQNLISDMRTKGIDMISKTSEVFDACTLAERE